MRSGSYEASLLPYKSVHEASHSWKTVDIWETIPRKKICHHQQLKKEEILPRVIFFYLGKEKKVWNYFFTFLWTVQTLVHYWHSLKDSMQDVHYPPAVDKLANSWHFSRNTSQYVYGKQLCHTTVQYRHASLRSIIIWNRLGKTSRHDFKVLNLKWLWRDFNTRQP